MKQPTSGGSYTRDPKTGALTQTEAPTAWDAPKAEEKVEPAAAIPAPTVKKDK